jgi:regulator of sirC expression with transglutaminase-like and TPR domain
VNFGYSADPQEYLRATSGLPDDKINLAHAALALAALDQPGVSLERYGNHLEKVGREVTNRYAALMAAGAENDCGARLAALKYVLADTHAYQGDTQSYEDLQNASLIRVIDRRKGLPVALAVLYIHAARAQGWTAWGLDVPGHFVCRLDQGGQRLIFDPFNACRTLEAADLRAFVKAALGEGAELSARYFEPASNRAILVRLQNNIKYRLIAAEDYEGALKVVENMRLIDPAEFRLLLDAGVLYARTNRKPQAIAALEDYIKVAPYDQERHDAALLLQKLRQELG